MPDPKTYKQHFQNKHPKNEIPDDLKDAWIKMKIEKIHFKKYSIFVISSYVMVYSHVYKYNTVFINFIEYNV